MGRAEPNGSVLGVCWEITRRRPLLGALVQRRTYSRRRHGLHFFREQAARRTSNPTNQGFLIFVITEFITNQGPKRFLYCSPRFQRWHFVLSLELWQKRGGEGAVRGFRSRLSRNGTLTQIYRWSHILISRAFSCQLRIYRWYRVKLLVLYLI